MTSTLYRHGVVHSPADPFAEAILVEDGTVAWLGADDTADGLVARADEGVDLRGALLAPGFVDAHVHVLDTAQADEGIDLRAAGWPRVEPGSACAAFADSISALGGALPIHR